MKNQYIFETNRLGFRLWNENDRENFENMNGNQDVMRFFPKTLDKKGSDELLDKINNHFNDYGYGLWAVELKKSNELIGFIGLVNKTSDAYFTPCIEIGWRLNNVFWNKGYATEGAKACLEYGFEKLGIDEIYSFTAVVNKPSINVMKKIDLTFMDEFNHPSVDKASILSKHVLYKIINEDWCTTNNKGV